MEIDKKLYEEIKQYCDLNGLKPKEYIHNLLKKAFMEDKYGKMPSVLVKKDRQVTEIRVKSNQGIEKIEQTIVVHKEDKPESISVEEKVVEPPKIEEKQKENVNLPKSKKVKL